MDSGQRQQEIIVVGAGLGGLASAALLARAGHPVRVLESASQPGGRARSRVQDGFVLNLGAHALYCKGPAQEVLEDLGVKAKGRSVGSAGSYVLHADHLYELPGTPGRLLKREFLSWAGTWSVARVLLSLGERKARALRGRNVGQWLQQAAPDPRAQALLHMLVRLTCYAHAPELLGADAAVRQLAAAVRHGVMYVDGGWQSLLDALLTRVQALGVNVELNAAVQRIEHSAGRVNAVRMCDGRSLPARAVVAAIEPHALSALLPEDALALRWAEASVPLRAACLDLGVYDLPHPERLNVQSLDAPLYFANHTAYAKLAPQGASLLSLVRYLAPGEDGRGCEGELRAFLERIEPGVYERAVAKRFMPNMIVHHDLPGPERARAQHPDIAGLHLVSEVSSARAMLADAVLDSARAAALRIEAELKPAEVASATGTRARSERVGHAAC